MNYSCEVCGKEFVAKKCAHRKYCSFDCTHKSLTWRAAQSEGKKNNPILYWKGKNRSLETNEKISASLMGNIPWNKGKHGIYTDEHRRKMSEARRGTPGYWTGKKRSPEDVEKFRNSHLGKKWPLELRIARSVPNSSNWLGGLSKLPWGPEFNRALKDSVRQRDHEACQLCGTNSGYRDGRRHAIHHIDYDKKNNDPNNLIALCFSCHMKTGRDRDKWNFFFDTYQEIRKDL